jgi:hypothetical protein
MSISFPSVPSETETIDMALHSAWRLLRAVDSPLLRGGPRSHDVRQILQSHITENVRNGLTDIDQLRADALKFLHRGISNDTKANGGALQSSTD